MNRTVAIIASTTIVTVTVGVIAAHALMQVRFPWEKDPAQATAPAPAPQKTPYKNVSTALLGENVKDSKPEPGFWCKTISSSPESPGHVLVHFDERLPNGEQRICIAAELAEKRAGK